MMDLTNNIAYVAHPDFLPNLMEELGEVSLQMGNLVFSPKKIPACFASDIWLDTTVVNFTSISEAVRILKAANRFWYLNPINSVGRSKLIAEQLRKLPNLNNHFPMKEPMPLIGCFSLLDNNTLVYAKLRSKNPPLGDFLFVEDKVNPPNRAYLKLWEALSIFSLPKKGEYAIDLGASPGGWSYVMQSLGVSVLAVDKAPLDEKIARLPGISFKQQSAFSIEPKDLEKPVDWLLCDVACYPERTLSLVKKWIQSGKAKKMIITIKLQGQDDLKAIAPFKEIPNSLVLHLLNNKHEVTFMYPKE